MKLNIIIGIFYAFAAIVGILIMNKKLDLSFWLMLNMFFDPGGYLSAVSEHFLDRLDFKDILIVFILISIYKIKGARKIIYQNTYFVKFLKFFLYFVLFYFIIYGAIIPYLKEDLNYSVFLLKNRRFVYGIILLFGVYLFALRGFKYFYLTTLFVALPTMILFWLTLITQIPLMEYALFERYRGSGIMRIGISSYGLFQILFPVSAIIYFINQSYNIRIKHKNLLYFVAFLILVTLLISLTRRTILDVIGSIFIIGFLVSKIIKTNIISIPFKIIVPTLILFLIILLLTPKYVNYLATVTADTFLLLTTGKNMRGESDNRVSGGGIYPEVYEKIEQNILFGTGYSYFTWEIVREMGEHKTAVSTRGYEFGQLADAASEIGFLNMFFSFGIIGFLFLLPLYISIYKLARKLYKIIRFNFNKLISDDPLSVVFSVLFILMVVQMFTYKIWSTGDEFIGSRIQIIAVWIGLGFALLHTNIKKAINK